MKKILLGIFIVSMFVISFSSLISACSCVIPGSPQEELEKSDFVFQGKVISVIKEGEMYKEKYKVTFNVSQGWKGDVPQEFEIYTSDSSASCGYYFAEGEEYVVYARNVEEKLQVDLCSRTNNIKGAKDDLEILNKKIDTEKVSFLEKVIRWFKNLFN